MKNRRNIKEKPLPKRDGFDFVIPGSSLTIETFRWHLSRYAFASRYVKGYRVLDIGCGTGYGSSYLMRKGAQSVIGADISTKAIELAKVNFNEPGLTFQQADASDMPFDDSSFDLITSMGTIDHLSDAEQFLLGVHRTLREGGYFVCSLLNREVITPFGIIGCVDPYHAKEYNPMELANLIGRYFGSAEVYGQNYGNKRWWQLRRIAYYVFIRKLRMPKKFLLSNFLSFFATFGNKEFKALVYSEARTDLVDSFISDWEPITTSEMASKYINYLVVGQKKAS